jgi:hypothetical protein
MLHLLSTQMCDVTNIFHVYSWRSWGFTWIRIASLIGLLNATHLRWSFPPVSTTKAKSKGKVVPVPFVIEHYAMKAYWGSGCIAPRILDLGTAWRLVVSFTPRSLYSQGESPWYPFDRRLGGPQSRSGRGGEETNSQPLPGLQTPMFQPIAQRYTTELSGLRKPNRNLVTVSSLRNPALHIL